MSAAVAKKVLEVFQLQSQVYNTKRFDLTDREVEILGLLAKGMSYKMIAETCGITWHTVNSHSKKYTKSCMFTQHLKQLQKLLNNVLSKQH